MPTEPRTGRAISHTAPANRGRLMPVLEAARAGGLDGVGFSLDPADGLVAVDLDGCRDALTGVLAPVAAGLLDDLPDTYAEVSPSGTGLRLFAEGRLDPAYRQKGRGLELYPRDSRQFVTVTGHHLPGRAGLLADHGGPLLAHQRMLGVLNGRTEVSREATGAGFDGPDAGLLGRAFRAKNGAVIRRLWGGNWDAYSSPSEALLALGNYLAFWTGPDAERLYVLLGTSRLVAATEGMRAKWESRRPHGPWGLVHVAAPAVRDCRAYYGGRPPAGPQQKPPHRGSFSSHANGEASDNPLYVAWGQVLAGEPAPGYGRPAEGYAMLAALCWHLARPHPDRRFRLDGRAAGKLIGVSPATAYRHFDRLQAGDPPTLLKTAEGVRGGLASEYAWVGRHHP